MKTVQKVHISCGDSPWFSPPRVRNASINVVSGRWSQLELQRATLRSREKGETTCLLAYSVLSIKAHETSYWKWMNEWSGAKQSKATYILCREFQLGFYLINLRIYLSLRFFLLQTRLYIISVGELHWETEENKKWFRFFNGRFEKFVEIRSHNNLWAK